MGNSSQDHSEKRSTHKNKKNPNYVVLAVGSVFLLLPVVTIAIYPDVYADIELFLRLIVSLGGGLIASAIPGLLEIKLPGIKSAGAIAVTVLFYFWNPARLSDNPWAGYEHIWALDSAQIVYDTTAQQMGKQNADEIAEILDDLLTAKRILVHKETIYPTWDRAEYLIGSQPELIVIHLSGFKDRNVEPTTQISRSLYSFLNYMTKHAPETKYLVYSRLGDDEGLRSKIMNDLIAIDPETLQNRLRLLSIKSRSLKDSVTRNEIRLAVRELLSVP